MSDTSAYGSFNLQIEWKNLTEEEASFSDMEDDELEAIREMENTNKDQEIHARQPIPDKPTTDVIDTPAAAGRFPVMSEADLNRLINDSASKSTDKMTKWGVNTFRHWLESRSMDLNFEEKSPEELDVVLRKFYAEVRNSEGNSYSKSTFVGIRASINRHLRNPPHNKTFSILESKEFHRSNQMFIAVVKSLKKQGNDKTTHHHPISNNDLQKLRSSEVLSVQTPKSLQRKVWFDITISFARRGRENFRELKYNSFIFEKDTGGMEYVKMAYNEATKNHSGENLKDRDHEQSPRMYATSTYNCPVASFKLYLKKRNPSSEFLFQQPRLKVGNDDDTWYTSRPIGIKTLNDMMKNISIDAGLERIYTNHCVRATTITMLSHAGVETREIMRISGHKNEASVRSYSTDSSEEQKRQYSKIIHGTTAPPQSNDLVLHSHACNEQTSYIDLNTTNILQYTCNPRSVTPTLQKQFEISNSNVTVNNYFGTGPM